MVAGDKRARSRFAPLPPIRFTELGFQGLYSKLGIETVFARPYNARAKVIERFFKEFQEGFEKLLPSYIGSSIQNKPAYMMRNEKLHKSWHNEYMPTIEETIKMIDITCNDIQEFYYFCKGRNLPPKVLKNTLALLNQMIKYFQNLGIIDRTCNFQVRRLSDKTNFTVDRIIFEV